jgi:DNA-binding FadR family transcriptional regulator
MAGSREAVAEQLRERILSGMYQPGDKLPSTRDLASSFGVARNTANDALHLLAREGLVDIGDKSRAVVLSPDEAAKTPDDRLADARAELLKIQSAVVETQRQLAELGERVSAALSKLGRRG